MSEERENFLVNQSRLSKRKETEKNCIKKDINLKIFIRTSEPARGVVSQALLAREGEMKEEETSSSRWMPLR